MKKVLVLRFIAMFLALYLPVITSGVPLYKHYCQGQLEESQWLFEAESCHEKETEEAGDSCCSTTSTCHSSPEEEEKDDCCENEVELYKADIQLIVKHSILDESNQLSLDFNYIPSISFIPAISQNVQSLIKPPDIQPYLNGPSKVVAFQQFLC